MSKIAFLYTGQGSQYVGMGLELYKNYQIVRDTFDKTDELLGYKLSDICFYDEVLINQTKYTQPAMVTLSIAITKLLKENNIKPNIVAGLSLGEYSALITSGVLSFDEGIKLVAKRGQIMTDAVNPGLGTMAAIIGYDRDKLKTLCDNEELTCEIANYNCPGQLVIGGINEAVNNVMEKAKEDGAKRVIPLNVSGPFHTSLLQDAKKLLKKEIDQVIINDPQIPIIMNVNAKYLEGNAKDLMINQVTNSVYFEDSLNQMIKDGVDTFIEIGSGKVLSGFVKKIDRKLITLNVEDIESLNKVLEMFKEV